MDGAGEERRQRHATWFGTLRARDDNSIWQTAISTHPSIAAYEYAFEVSASGYEHFHLVIRLVGCRIQSFVKSCVGRNDIHLEPCINVIASRMYMRKHLPPLDPLVMAIDGYSELGALINDKLPAEVFRYRRQGKWPLLAPKPVLAFSPR